MQPDSASLIVLANPGLQQRHTTATVMSTGGIPVNGTHRPYSSVSLTVVCWIVLSLIELHVIIFFTPDLCFCRCSIVDVKLISGEYILMFISGSFKIGDITVSGFFYHQLISKCEHTACQCFQDCSWTCGSAFPGGPLPTEVAPRQGIPHIGSFFCCCWRSRNFFFGQNTIGLL